MLHPSSPDWVHDNYNLPTPNSQFFTNGMTPPTSLHLSPTINSHHNSSANGSSDNLTNGLQNIPPSPPITVNSACSEMSSPGIGSNGNGGVIGSGDASPSITSNNNLSRPKSPYEWLKKPSYQNQPNSGMWNIQDFIFFAQFSLVFLKMKLCSATIVRWFQIKWFPAANKHFQSNEQKWRFWHFKSWSAHSFHFWFINFLLQIRENACFSEFSRLKPNVNLQL